MRALKRTAMGLVAVTLSAGVLAGCGSSSESAGSAATGATTGAALTKAEYVAKVNAICTKIDDAANAIGDSDADSLAQAKADIEKLTANAKEGVEELKALTPPAALQKAHDTLVATSGESIALSEKITSAVEAGTVDQAQLKADATKAQSLVTRQMAAAKDLGLSNCFTGDEPGDTNDPDMDDAGMDDAS